MKDSTITYIVLVLVVLLGIGWIVFNPKISESPVPKETEFESSRQTEEALIENENISEGERSGEFSSSQKNEAPTPSETTSSSPLASGNVSSSSSANTNPSLPSVFTLGTYYIKNIQEKGVEACKGSRGQGSQQHDIDYDAENFHLSKIVLEPKEAYLFVDAKEIPKDLCATIIQTPRAHSHFERVNILVN